MGGGVPYEDRLWLAYREYCLDLRKWQLEEPCLFNFKKHYKWRKSEPKFEYYERKYTK